MPYIGNTPAEKYAAFDVQYFTTSATTSYTLDHAVANELDIRLVINNVIQEPGSGKAYTASGTTLTLSAATAGTDTMYCVYTGKASQTVNPPAGSVGINQLSATGTKDATTFLAGDNSFKTVSGTTINNNADNRVITGSGTANTLNGEANLTYNGTILGVGGTGDLGVGVHIKTADSGGGVEANADELVVEGSGNSGLSILSGTSNVGAVHFNDSGGNERGAFKYNHAADQMQFKVAGNLVATWAGSEVVFNENSLDQGFRIESNGKANLFFVNGGGDQIYINNNDNISAQGVLQIVGLANHNVVNIQVGTNGERGMQWFNQSGVAAGDIVVNASSVAYNTSSDYRLKENVDYTWDATTRLKQLKPARFNWIEDDTNTLLDGFLAHEVSSIVPEAVSGVKDATVNEVLYTRNILYDEDDVLPKGKNLGDIKHAIGDVKQPAGINPQRIDQSKLVPLLVKTIQELEARVQTLENA